LTEVEEEEEEEEGGGERNPIFAHVRTKDRGWGLRKPGRLRWKNK